MKTVLAALIAGLLAGCAGSGGGDRPARVSTALVGEGTAVQVLVTSLPEDTRLVAARLLGPEGQRIETTSVDDVSLESGPRASGGGARPSVGVGVSGGSGGGVRTGVGVGLNIFNFGGGGSRTLDRRAVTEIPILDPEAYAARPEAWRVEVDLRQPDGSLRTRSFSAPGS